jgi:predicted ATPase
MLPLESHEHHGNVHVLPQDGLKEPIFLWGPLRVLEKIGEGGFGEVYRAFEPILQREVAVKLSREDRASQPTTQGMPMAEARRLARVRHPNVLTIHGIEEHDGRAGIWTEYVRGATLETLLNENGPLVEAELLRIGTAICRALSAVHAVGVVHGDIKTSNVMREAGGRIVLMDFGAGVDLGPFVGHDMGPAGSVTGTPLIMAPELLEGRPLSFASDVYAVGVLLYRLASGRYPHVAANLDQLIARVLGGGHEALAELQHDLSRPLCEAIERAMSTDPSARFASAEAMRAALESCSDTPTEPAARNRPTGLPREIGHFVGRGPVLLDVRRQVLGRPLVTLTGVGGSGKTRIALRVAAELHDGFEGGAHWIDLIPAGADEVLTLRLVRALGIPEKAGADAETLLGDFLREKRTLLVLDNCEHVRIAVANMLERLLPSCPLLHVLATSREELGLEQETAFPIPPMTVPDAVGPRGGTEVLDSEPSESVQLFVDRARERRPDFVLTAANAPAIERICCGLDGIPLAVELAAARVTALGTDQIAQRLEQSLRLLSRGESDGTPHHRTMQACIDWSFRLLSAEEQTLLERLSIFAGSWSQEAAERVCADSFDPPTGLAIVGTREVGDLLSALVEKSLVQSETGRDEERDGSRVSYRMLEMVRRFARERIGAEEETATRGRMVAYYVALCDRAQPDMGSPREAAWITRFAAEHENLRIALDACDGRSDHLDPAMRMITVLRRYWLVRRQLREGVTWVERLLLPHVRTERARADACYIAASLTLPQSDTVSTRRFGEESLALMRKLGDRKGTAAVLSILGMAAIAQADNVTGRRYLEESIAIDREMGNLGPIPNRLNSLGIVAGRQRDHEGADRYFGDALELFRRADDKIGISTMLANLSTNARLLGQMERARDLAQEAVEVGRACGHGPSERQATRALAMARLHMADFDGARRLLRDALMQRDPEDAMQLIWGMEGLGQLEEAEGHAARAVRIIAAAAALRDRMGVPIPEIDGEDRARRLDALKRHLGEAAFATAWAEGNAMSVEVATAYALATPRWTDERPDLKWGLRNGR